MKRFIVMIMMLLPISAMASLPEVSELANKYSSTEGVAVVNLTGEMLAMAGASGDIDTSMIEDIIIIQTEKARYAKDISKRMKKIVADANLKSIANVDDEGTKVGFYQKTNGEIMDFIIFVSEGSEVAILDICGNFDEESIAEILNQFENF